MVTALSFYFMGVIIPLHVILLLREARMDKSALRYLLSWVPLVLTWSADIVDQYVPLPGRDFFVIGFALTIAVQIIQMLFDLQRQYRQSLHYYQLQKELVEARVSIMTSQIRPHFMYNALTSIAMMCTLDPPTPRFTVWFQKSGSVHEDLSRQRDRCSRFHRKTAIPVLS